MITTKEKIAVMQAYDDGKTVLYRDKKEYDWYETHDPLWDWDTFDYRVKPDPKLRPYKDAQELLQAQREHGMYIEIDKGHYVLPNNILGNEIEVNYSKQLWRFSELVDKKWADGTPVGVMEE